MMKTATQNGWKTTSLKDFAEIIKDAWKPGDEMQNYIGLEHINEGDLTLSGVGSSKKLESNKFRFKSGDILFGKLRPYFRKVVVPNFDGVCSTDIWVIRAKKNYDQKYLFYFMANPVLIDKSMGASTGTHMPRADWDYLQNTIWEVPSLNEQRAIAAILSSFDDKIELLKKQNQTLGTLAQLLFNEWFVDFNFPNQQGKPYKQNGGRMLKSELGEIPEEWQLGRLGDLLRHIKKGINPANKPDEKFYHYSIPAFDKSRAPVLEKGKIIMSNKYEVFDHTFLVSKLNPSTPRIWTIFDAPKNSVCSTEFQVLKPNQQDYFSFIHCCLNSSRFTAELASKVQGTSGSHQRVKPDDILNIILDIPPDNILIKFQNLVFGMLSKIELGASQIQILTNLRDMLLPKLMRGELRFTKIFQ